MKPLELQLPQQKNWDYIAKNIGYKQVVDKTKSAGERSLHNRSSSSGACAGCARLYIMLASQRSARR